MHYSIMYKGEIKITYMTTFRETLIVGVLATITVRVLCLPGPWMETQTNATKQSPKAQSALLMRYRSSSLMAPWISSVLMRCPQPICLKSVLVSSSQLTSLSSGRYHIVLQNIFLVSPILFTLWTNHISLFYSDKRPI